MRALSLAIAVVTLGCSATKPESIYPPNVGPLPVRPLPSGDDFATDVEPTSVAEPSPKGPSPVDAALPSSGIEALTAKAACTEKVCALAAWIPDPAWGTPAPTGKAAPAALWQHDVKDGSTVVFPRHSQLTVQGVVVAGGVLASADEGGPAQKLDAWGAFRAEGAGVKLKAEGGDAKIVVVVSTTAASLGESLELGKKQGFKVRWLKRPGGSALQTKKLGDVEPWSWMGGAARARVAFGGDAAKSASLSVLMMSGDSKVPEHDHPESWEHIGNLGGSGNLVVAGTPHAVGPGAVIGIPKADKHSFTPSGKTVVAVQVYVPSGPEQRYEKLAHDAEAGGSKAKTATP